MATKAETWLTERLDYTFDDARLLQLALTHRSAPGDNNERLEFLGDAVLDFVISEAIFRTHPMAQEGDLSRLRASLVNDATLADIAVGLDVGKHLILGSGEEPGPAAAQDQDVGSQALDRGHASSWLAEVGVSPPPRPSPVKGEGDHGGGPLKPSPLTGEGRVGVALAC